MRMPFGKYRNWEVQDIPEDYLLWAHANLRDISPWLRSEMAAVLDALQRERAERFKAERQAERREVSTDIVGAWYRQMAKEFHPDHRGNHEGMKAVNRGRELLLELTEK